MPEYKIKIHRRGVRGNLTFSIDGKEVVSSSISWDVKKRIPAGSYDCAATRMANTDKDKPKVDSVTGLSRPGIFIGKFPGIGGVFIHEGNISTPKSRDTWSDGCIILKRDKMMEMWTSITPKEEYHVKVEITDEFSLE